MWLIWVINKDEKMKQDNEIEGPEWQGARRSKEKHCSMRQALRERGQFIHS